MIRGNILTWKKKVQKVHVKLSMKIDKLPLKVKFHLDKNTMNHVNFLSFDNDGRKPSKCQVSFLSLIFVLKCISKSILIRIRDRETKKN